MKDIRIKVWPEIMGQLPALVPLQSIAPTKSNNVIFDFTNVYQVSSSGLVIIIINILKARSLDINSRTCKIQNPNDNKVSELLAKMGLYNVIDEYFPEKDLFWVHTKPGPVEHNYLGCNINSIPVYKLSFSNGINRRSCIDNYVDWLLQTFSTIEKKYHLKSNHIVPIFKEMAKNSSDHTEGNAFFGMDFVHDKENNELKILFSFGDLGIGINQSIAKFIKDDPIYTHKDRHLSLSDAYHYALASGNTTKPKSGNNKGLGMTIIFDLAKALNLNLSVFDANSRGILSEAKNKTHVELRKVFYNVGNGVGFYYYGDLTLKQKK